MSGWDKVATLDGGAPVRLDGDLYWAEAYRAAYEREMVRRAVIDDVWDWWEGYADAYLLAHADPDWRHDCDSHYAWQSWFGTHGVGTTDWIEETAPAGDSDYPLVETAGGRSLYRRYHVGAEGEDGSYYLLSLLGEAGFDDDWMDLSRPRRLSAMGRYFREFYGAVNLLATIRVLGFGRETIATNEDGWSDHQFAGAGWAGWETERASAWADIPDGEWTVAEPDWDVGKVGYASWFETDKIHVAWRAAVHRVGALAYLKSIEDADDAVIAPTRILVGAIYERAEIWDGDTYQLEGMPYRLEMSGDGGANWTTLGSGTTSTDAGYHAVTGEISGEATVAGLLTDDALFRLAYDGDENADTASWDEDETWYSEAIKVDQLRLFVEFDWTYKE